MQAPGVDELLRLIDSIYEAGAQPDRWAAALTLLADVTGSNDATMGGQTASQIQMFRSARTDPDYIRSYAEHYHARNPMQLAAHGQAVGRAVLDTMIMDVERFQTTDFFNEWCKPQGYISGGSINLAASGGWRALVMVTGPTSIEPHTHKLLDAVAPHLCRAFQLNQVLHDAQALGLGAMAALEHADKGAFIVDRNRRVRAANALAEQIVTAADGLFLQDGRLSGLSLSDTNAINRAIANCERGDVESSGASVWLSRGLGHSPLKLLCIPFPTTAFWPGFEQNVALIFVTDPDASLRRHVQRATQKFGLTPAESELAWEIARTGGRKSAAERRGVSLATARTQLSSIFDKTGVRRQADLIRLLMQDGDERAQPR